MKQAGDLVKNAVFADGAAAIGQHHSGIRFSQAGKVFFDTTFSEINFGAVLKDKVVHNTTSFLYGFFFHLSLPEGNSLCYPALGHCSFPQAKAVLQAGVMMKLGGNAKAAHLF